MCAHVHSSITFDYLFELIIFLSCFCYGVCVPVCVRIIFFDFSLTVKVAPHECVIRTGQP